MIKFNCIIHKETGTLIPYEDWKKQGIENDFVCEFVQSKERKEYKYKEMLFSDDFEIIYHSEFTVDELYNLHESTNDYELKAKMEKLIIKQKKTNIKYGIEV